MFNLNIPTLLRTQAFIDGSWCQGDAQKTFAVENPATGAIIARVAELGATETSRAITAAANAQTGWAQTTVKVRSQLLRSWFDLVMQNQEDLAQILTLEQGK